MVSLLLVLFLCSCVYVGVYISSIVGIVCVCLCDCVPFVYVCICLWISLCSVIPCMCLVWVLVYSFVLFCMFVCALSTAAIIFCLVLSYIIISLLRWFLFCIQAPFLPCHLCVSLSITCKYGFFPYAYYTYFNFPAFPVLGRFDQPLPLFCSFGLMLCGISISHYIYILY